MKTLTIAASRLLRYHESKNTPCFAAELIGKQSFVSLSELDRAYNELLAGEYLVATENTGNYSLPDAEVIERPLYLPKDGSN